MEVISAEHVPPSHVNGTGSADATSPNICGAAWAGDSVNATATRDKNKRGVRFRIDLFLPNNKKAYSPKTI
jgi:hypothetical protein